MQQIADESELYDAKREKEAEDPAVKKNKLTDWKNEPSFKDLNQNYVDAQSDHKLLLDELERRKINMDGGAPINAPKGRSKARPKLIRKMAEWKYPALEEPFLNTTDMFELKPRTWEDVQSARQNAMLLNYQWSTQVDKVELVGDVVRTIVDEGTVIVKTGWEFDEEEILVDEEVPVYATPEESIAMLQMAVQNGEMDEAQAQQIVQSGQPMQKGTELIQVPKTVLVKNRPTYEVCDNRNVIIDPTANGNLADVQFIIHEYDTTMSDLKKEEYYEEVVVDPETGEERIESYGIYHNLDKIKVKEAEDTHLYENDTDEYETSFEFGDKPRKKLRAYEYWGYWDIDGTGETEVIIATWVGNTFIRMEKSPFPFHGLPFSIAKYMPRKNRMYGESDGDLLVENQESIGRMKRAAYDITADTANGQEFIDEQFFSGPSQKDNYESGKTVYFRHGMDPRVSIHRKSIDNVPRTVFDMIALENNDAESLVGTKAFSQGIGSQALGNVVAGIRSALDATSKRELSILRRLSEQLFKDLARKTIQMNQAFLDEETTIRITNEEFVTIKRQDIAGEFDIQISVSTPERDNDMAEKLNMMMQTNAASMHSGMAKIIYAKMAKLWKMPDLEHEVLSFEPEPDPMQEKIQQIQLENAELENKKLKMEIIDLAKKVESEDSKIEERRSRIAQNLNSETEENKATARLKNAQAEKTKQEADLARLKFARSADGTERKEKVEDKELDHLSKLQLEEAKSGAKEQEITHKTINDAELERVKAENDVGKEMMNQMMSPDTTGSI